jgi:DNA-directed RNA polymerase specialized sigma24 family protein
MRAMGATGVAAKGRDSEAPEPAAVEDARSSIEAGYRKWGEASKDIAAETIARALKSFDASAGTTFRQYAWAISRNVAKEMARAQRRQDPDARVERASAPDWWSPLLLQMDGKAFSAWFTGTIRGVAEESTVGDAVKRSARDVIFLLQSLELHVLDAGWKEGDPVAAAPTDDWTPVYTTIVARAEQALARRKGQPTAEDVLREVLRAVGVSGEGFERWLAGIRERRRVISERDAQAGYAPDQTATLMNFLDRRCSAGPDARVQAGALREAYELFCHDKGQGPIPAKDFGLLIKSLVGVTAKRSTRGYDYFGIGLLSEQK